MTTVYALGSNGSSQLGIGHAADVSVPKPVLLPSTFPTIPVTIRAGGNHTLLLSDSGALFAAGDSSAGACGLASDAPAPVSEVQLGLGKVCFAAATWEASIIVTADEAGKATLVWAFGTGNKGELGLGPLIFRSARAQRVEGFPTPGQEVVDVAAGVAHVVVVLSNGECWGWGNGRKGQLGEPAEVVEKPRRIAGLGFHVSRAVCGREFTALFGEDQVLILGGEKAGVKQGAVGRDIKGWKDVGASWGSVFVLKDGGQLLSWGRDDHGQLAPASLPPIKHIAVGSEHVLALSRDGEVVAWGWGEHGNCGPNTEDGDVKGTWNVVAAEKYLPSGSKIISIGAGCATSWICLGSA